MGKMDTSSSSFIGSDSNGNPKFKQGKRCCWGGLPLWGFVLLCVFIFLCVTAAIIIPVIFIPIAANSVQHTVDNTNFEITSLHDINFNITDILIAVKTISSNVTTPAQKQAAFGRLLPTSEEGKYLIIEASLLLSNIDELGKDAVMQATEVALTYNAGNVTVPDSTTKTVATQFFPTTLLGVTTIPKTTLTTPTTQVTDKTVMLTLDQGLLAGLQSTNTTVRVASNYQVALMLGCGKLGKATQMLDSSVDICTWSASGSGAVKKTIAAST
eukprot:Pgem_evm1s16363